MGLRRALSLAVAIGFCAAWQGTRWFRLGERLLAPLLSFTTEEVWKNLTKPEDAPPSVHMALFPECGGLAGKLTEAAQSRMNDWPKLIEVREAVLKALEGPRQEKVIGAPLEAKVTLHTPADLKPLLEARIGDLPGLFIVSQVVVVSGGESLSVTVERAGGTKCERCWKYTFDVGASTVFPTVCGACTDVLRSFVTVD